MSEEDPENRLIACFLGFLQFGPFSWSHSRISEIIYEWRDKAYLARRESIDQPYLNLRLIKFLFFKRNKIKISRRIIGVEPKAEVMGRRELKKSRHIDILLFQNSVC